MSCVGFADLEGPVVVDGRCTACGACLDTCPSGALVAAPGLPFVVDQLCTRCLECVEICPRGAITAGRGSRWAT